MTFSHPCSTHKDQKGNKYLHGGSLLSWMRSVASWTSLSLVTKASNDIQNIMDIKQTKVLYEQTYKKESLEYQGLLWLHICPTNIVPLKQKQPHNMRGGGL